jgi:antibiotic biosynthesis monooxygenase (ABM) superfamily enzyme
MTLLGFQNREELVDWLSAPESPEFLQKAQEAQEELDEQYELLERQREDEEKHYRSKEASAPNPTHKRAPFWKASFWMMSSASTLLVLFGIARMPYGYYMLLRLVVCSTAVFGFCNALDLQRSPWLWVYGVIALLYNPISPVRLGSKNVWELINLATVALLWIGAWKLVSRTE